MRILLTNDDGIHAHGLKVLEAGYVTVTPLHLDMTHRESLARMAAVYG